MVAVDPSVCGAAPVRALEGRTHRIDEADALKRVVYAIASLRHADNHLRGN